MSEEKSIINLLNRVYDTSNEALISRMALGPKKLFREGMLDIAIAIDRWDQELISTFVINPNDSRRIVDELAQELMPVAALQHCSLPENCIGSVWAAFIVEDSRCPPGMVIGAAEGKPIDDIDCMIADNVDEGKQGYAWRKILE